ncbi:MAG: SusE domain-containing protein [Flavobacterium sp.]
MKNIFKKIFTVSALSLALISCEDEQDLFFLTPEADFEILSPNSGDAVELRPETPTNPGLSLTWAEADFGTPTEITYAIEIDKTGDEFDTPFVVTSTTNTFATITSEELNSAVLGVGLTPFTQEGIDIRIKATIGTGSNESFSNTIVYLVTAYSTDLPKLYVIGNFLSNSGYGSNWSPAPTLPSLAASAFGQTDYEGFVMMNEASPEFKLLPTNTSFDGDYGDDGNFAGTLAQTGEENIQLPGAGYYRIRANTSTLTYTVAPVSWGIIGAATPTGWDSDTDLTYNPTTKKLEIASIYLNPGPFKFRGNNAWSNGFDFGTVNADGYLVEGGDLNFTGPAGNYKVILDLSNPRKYTYELIAL